jgi:DNA-binding transcriptional MerR regulator|tara:strand:+ start:319 stop:483 length:165 start_codon:yes stop_codon:yes gene_type:complete
LGVSPKTLWNFQREKLIKGTTFRGRRYYSKDAIIDCIKIHFNIKTGSEWDSVWD